jgi:hypothetical protein
VVNAAFHPGALGEDSLPTVCPGARLAPAPLCAFHRTHPGGRSAGTTGFPAAKRCINRTPIPCAPRFPPESTRPEAQWGASWAESAIA